jgi:thiamine transport system ATP-binding protein
VVTIVPEAVELRDVTVALGDQRVLDGVSLVAPAGRTTAVLGPSGVGKSTLLRVIAGLQTLTAGAVRIGDGDVTAVPAHRRGVGFAFQEPSLFPHLDVAGNVAFGLRVRRAPAAEVARRVDEVLDLVGLAGFGSRRVHRLSGGEAQRVALARALTPGPAVLCLDEPLGALDRALHDRLVEDLRHLFDDLAITVVYVTHDQQEALALADHLVVLGEGRVLQAGDPRQVWRQPASGAVAEFLGHDLVRGVEVGVDGVVRAQGRELVRLAPDMVPAGPASLAVRPGAARLANDPGTGVPVRVVDLVLTGDDTVATLDLGGDLGTIRTVLGVPVARGDEVRVCFDPSHLWVLTGDANAA